MYEWAAGPGRPLEEVVAHQPLLAAPEAPQLRAGHEEDAPHGEPARRLARAVGLGQDRQHLVPAHVQVGEPGLAGAPVVVAGDAPVAGDDEVALEVEQQVVGGHLAAGEEVGRHPVGPVLHLERVGELTMREDVDEEPSAGSEPARHPGQHGLVVAQVLEHLHREDPVEPLRRVEGAGVGGDDRDVAEAARPGPRLDEALLAPAVGDGGDGAAREALGQVKGQRAPAAAQLQQPHPVRHLRPRHRQGQHGVVGGGQVLGPAPPQAAAVLEARAEHLLEEGGRDLVVLLVGGVGPDGDVGGAAGRHPGHPARQAGHRPAGPLLAEPLAQEAPDPEAHQRVWQEAALGQRERPGTGEGRPDAVGRWRWGFMGAAGHGAAPSPGRDGECSSRPRPDRWQVRPGQHLDGCWTKIAHGSRSGRPDEPCGWRPRRATRPPGRGAQGSP